MLLVVKDADCPGLPAFLVSLAYGTETALIRGVLYDWYLMHSTNGTLTAAVAAALDGPGGLIRPTRSAKSRPPSHFAHAGQAKERPASPGFGHVHEPGEFPKGVAAGQMDNFSAPSISLPAPGDSESAKLPEEMSRLEIESLGIFDAVPL